MKSSHGRKRLVVGNLEDYKTKGCLGKGGYGSVVKARHRATGKTVAIKRLAFPAKSLVMREKRFLEACSGNPFVVGFHGVVRALNSTELRLVMEHVKGPSFRDFARRGDDGPPLPEATVRAIMWQLLTGAKKMHALRIVHRDIKPDNILISADQNMVKICDFGLALRVPDDAPPYDQAGSMWYMAPEVLLGKTDYDALVDTWALGCVMAELIGGKVIFRGVSNEDQLRCITDVLGIPDDKTWPWFTTTPFATTQRYRKRQHQLRNKFPETMLSEQGFEVLNGLLTWNPEKRLTARAALKHPWFADLCAPAQARKKEKLASALPHMMDPLFAPPTNLHKRRKLQCV